MSSLIEALPKKRVFDIEEDDQVEIVQVKKKVLPPDFVFSLPPYTDEYVPARIEVYGSNIRFDFNQETSDLQVVQVNHVGSKGRTVVFKRLPVKSPHLTLGVHTKPENVKITPNPKTADNCNVAFRIQF
jgi:hypothetical protein